MKNYTIRARILMSFAVVLAVMLLMGGVAYTQLAHIEAQASGVEAGTAPGLYYGTQIMLASLADYSLLQAQVIENEPAAIRDVEAEIQANRAKLDGLNTKYQSILHDAKGRENLQEIEKLRAPYLVIFDQVHKLAQNTEIPPELRPLVTSQLRPAFEKLLAALHTLVEADKADLDGATKSIVTSAGTATIGILASLAVALLLAVASGYLLLRAITRPLERLVSVVEVMRQGDFSRRLGLERRDEFGVLASGFDRMVDEVALLIGDVQKAGIQVNTSVTEIAATAKEQQATAGESAATTAEIGATSKEISATSKDLVRTMNEVSEVAEQTGVLAGSGQTGLARMEETMGHVMEAAGSINSKLAVLNVKATNINQVVTTITKVADQTNLLSLNAAIEAEKAGEYGRGFTVVATEIRRLADQTAVATHDIEQMVREIQSAASAGVMGMDKFSEEVRRGMQEIQQVGGQLSQIIHQVQTLVPRFEAVNEGMQTQATGAEQISDALVQLSEATQQTVESLRQSSLATEQLSSVSNGLRGSIARFRLQA
jgi:methyl-accepting chemotaxis protein WspA